MRSFKIFGICLQTDRHAQSSHASVVLTQDHPKYRKLMHENYCFKCYKSQFVFDAFNCKHTTIKTYLVSCNML